MNLQDIENKWYRRAYNSESSGFMRECAYSFWTDIKMMSKIEDIRNAAASTAISLKCQYAGVAYAGYIDACCQELMADLNLVEQETPVLVSAAYEFGPQEKKRLEFVKWAIQAKRLFVESREKLVKLESVIGYA